MKLFFVRILLSLAPPAPSSDLKPFTTDGCSRFPDGTSTRPELWLNCCTVHDIAYWQGGTSAERLQADRALQHCVAAVGKPTIAWFMFVGVRVGGTPYLPISFRWGYGWPYLRPYGVLTKSEMKAVQASLNTERIEP
jgi:hypothetical protein